MEHSAFQPTSTVYVNAFSYIENYFSGQKSKVTYILQSDLRGRLPVSLVESCLPSMLVETLNNLQGAIDANLTAP